MKGFSGGSDGKESAHDARDLGLIPGLGRSPGEGKGTLPGSSPGGSREFEGWTESARKTYLFINIRLD